MREQVIGVGAGGRRTRRQLVSGCGRLLGLGAAASVLAACGALVPGADPPSAAGQRGPALPLTRTGGGGVVIASDAIPVGMDVDFNGGGPLTEVMGNTMDELVGFNSVPREDGTLDLDISQPQGRLAEAWDISPDGRTITFHLRKGVRSGYGNELTASDVKWSWERRWMTRGIGLFYFGVLKLASPDDIVVVDRYTVSFTSSGYTTASITQHSNLGTAILDATEARRHATPDDPWAMAWTARRGAGFGPYLIDRWTPNAEVVLRANEAFWAGPPAVKQVVFRRVPTAAQRLALLLDGAVDIARGLGPREQQQLRHVSDVQLAYWNDSAMMCLGINNKAAPFEDKRVRQALNYAIPREDIVTTVWFGVARVARSPVPDIFPAYSDRFFPYEFNLDKARELMRSAGLEQGIDTSLSYNEASPEAEQSAILLQTTLKQIGVRCTLERVEAGDYFERAIRHEFPLFIMQDQANTPDSGFALSLWLHSRSGINFANYANAHVDDLIDSSLGEPDETKRLSTCAELQRVVLDDAPWGFMVQPPYNVAYRREVSGLQWNLGDFLRWDALKHAG